MNMSFPSLGGTLTSGLPHLDDDIAWSAVAGRLLVQAHDKFRLRPSFSVGNEVRVRDGIRVILGKREGKLLYIDNTSGSTYVEEIVFANEPDLIDGEPTIIGWVARFKGANFFVACSSLCLAA